jgi:hypothetical protein
MKSYATYLFLQRSCSAVKFAVTCPPTAPQNRRMECLAKSSCHELFQKSQRLTGYNVLNIERSNSRLWCTCRKGNLPNSAPAILGTPSTISKDKLAVLSAFLASPRGWLAFVFTRIFVSGYNSLNPRELFAD